MTFAAPLWLVGLVPWIALVALLFIGRREGTVVPFLNLWRGPEAVQARVRASVVLPPMSIILILAALLLAVLGAAKPLWVVQPESNLPKPSAATTQPANISIVNASAVRLARPQVMVRIRNDSALTQSALKVGQVEKTVDLPPRGEERSYFVDLDRIDPSTLIQLGVTDDIAWDNRVSVVQEKAWPMLETHGVIPPAVERMIETYRKVRPAGSGARHVIVTNTIPANTQPAVIIATAEGPTISGEPKIEAHPITENVNWPTLARQELRVAPSPGSGWQTIAAITNRPIIAIRETSARQVWVGMTSEQGATTADFVVLWTNIFDWVGQGEESFEMVRPPAPAPTTQAAEAPGASTDLSSAFLTLAIALIFLASLIGGLAKIAR